MADLVFELALQRRGQRCSVAASPLASVADAIEQRDAAAVFVVEQSGHLAHEAHRGLVRIE